MLTRPCSNLSRRRYAQNDETLYVAPEDERTDYVRALFFDIASSDFCVVVATADGKLVQWRSEVSRFFVLAWRPALNRGFSTGKRRYGHPAFTGVLPEPWLPLKKGQTLVNGYRNGLMRIPLESTHGIVLSLRKRYSMLRKKVTRGSRTTADGENDEVHALVSDTHASNPWAESDAGPSQNYQHHRLSYDPASGVIMLPEGDDWLMDDDDDDSSDEYGNATPQSGEAASNTSQEDLGHVSPSSPPTSPKRRHATYYHHPERRRPSIPGAFPS